MCLDLFHSLVHIQGKVSGKLGSYSLVLQGSTFCIDSGNQLKISVPMSGLSCDRIHIKNANMIPGTKRGFSQIYSQPSVWHNPSLRREGREDRHLIRK